MRENGLQAAARMGSPRGPRNHDGTIIPEAIDTMWGTDMTATVTVEHGQVAVFIAVDHCSAECVGIHAALNGTRHEALEPVRQGVAERFGGVEKDAAAGLGIRHDHGSQYMSRDFQKEITWPPTPPRPPLGRLHSSPEFSAVLGLDQLGAGEFSTRSPAVLGSLNGN
jgi:putative transposase